MTKILTTIGPSSATSTAIEAFAKKTRLFRLNGSHNKLDWHVKTVKLIREVCPSAVILVDVPGIKPRTNNINKISIRKGQLVIFGSSTNADESLVISLTRSLPKIEQHIDFFSINDGQFLFQTIDFGDDFIAGKSLTDFTLQPRKGLNIPNSVYDDQAQLSVYDDFIESITDLDVNALGLSFVQNADLISQIRQKKPKLLMVAKIENSEGLRNCSEIVSVADAVMIDRGDLAAEIGMSSLFGSIEQIAFETKWAGKPLIMATENLETMMVRQLPSKSEVMSIAHSISIGADCIMLSEETAIAKNGVDIVHWLEDHLRRLPKAIKYSKKPSEKKKFPEIWQMLSTIEHLPVIVMSKSGHAIFEYLAIMPNAEFSVISDNPKVANLLELLANKIEFISIQLKDKKPSEIVRSVIRDNKARYFNGHDKVLAIYVSEYVSTSRANCITIFHKEDF